MHRRNSIRFSVLAFFTIFAIFATAPKSQALETLFDNLNQSGSGGVSVGNSQWPAQAFTTTSTGFVLNEVSLRLRNSSGTTGNYEIQVWDSLGAGGSPGAQVGSAIFTGLAQNLSGSSSNLLTISGLNVSLALSTTYYLLARGTALTDVGDPDEPSPGSLSWSVTSTNTSPSYIRNSSGWNGPYSFDYYMSVTAVPEPSSWALAGLAALACGWSGRKRIC